MIQRALILSILIASPVLAQNFLEPLFVTASRSEQSGKDTAYSTAYIGADDMQQNTRRTLPEALQLTPGVLVQKTAHGHGSPIIRGFTGRQNLLLFDGIRLNNSTLRGGPVQYWNTIDSLAIDHLELIKSQGSVLYGSDAVGGTVNAFSKSSDFRSRDEGVFYDGGMLSHEYRANGEGSHISRIESEIGKGQQWGLRVGISAKEFGDIADSAVGRMRGTGYPEQDFDMRLDWAVTPDSTLTFASNYVNQDRVSRWHRTTNNPGWTHGSHVTAPGLWTANDYDQERSLSYLRYAGENSQTDALIQRWNATVSYQTVMDSEYQNRNPASNSIRKSNIDLNTIGVDLTLESDTKHGTWVYGVDYYRDQVNSSGSRNNSAGTAYVEMLPVADDSSYDLLGVFGQYIWKPLDALEITAGARYTYAQASLGRFYDSTATLRYDQDEHWDAAVGSLRALYRLDKSWSVFGGISQAFRSPNLDDLTGNMTAKSGSSTLGSTDVQPENFMTYEMGVRRETETLSVEATVFYTDIKDMITSVPITSGSGTSITTNAADGYLYGVELAAAWRFHPQWTLSGFSSWQEGRNQTPAFIGGPINESPPPRLLPLSGSVALRWTESEARYWIEGRILASDTADRTSAADQAADNQRIPTDGTPSYVAVSVRAGWKVNDHLDLTCALENLLDQDYRLHGSGQNEPGLTSIFGVRYTW